MKDSWLKNYYKSKHIILDLKSKKKRVAEMKYIIKHKQKIISQKSQW